MKTKHTPGPWVAVRSSCYWEVSPQSRSEDDPYSVADVCCSAPGNPDDGLQEANARLIAAAPELLEALQGLLTQALQSDLNNHSNEWGIEAIEKATAAIKKATGETE